MGFSISVLSTYKPNSVVASAEATIEVIGTATCDEVIDAGLAALHEPRSSLFGYGIRDGFDRQRQTVTDAVVVVYANRD